MQLNPAFVKNGSKSLAVKFTKDALRVFRGFPIYAADA